MPYPIGIVRPAKDLMLEIPRGTATGLKSVNKFGRSTNVDAGADTDIWDGANATDDTKIWVAPTQARTHTIVSTNVADDEAGVGAKTIQIYGLTDWDSKETSEVITMDGTTGVVSTKSYVIIHRMKVLTKGASGPNVGVITATASTDGTITAQINAGEGQTQMAIYGVPSTQIAYVTRYYFSAIKGALSISVAASLLANPEPDAELLGFLVKHTIGIATDGSNAYTHNFGPYAGFAGPCIIKLQGNSSSNNTDVSGGFDLILADV